MKMEPWKRDIIQTRFNWGENGGSYKMQTQFIDAAVGISDRGLQLEGDRASTWIEALL